MRGITNAAAALAVAALLSAGCRNSDEDHAAELAKDALNIKETKETTTGVAQRKVVVEEIVRVVDAETGKLLTEKKKSTPVVVQTEIKKDVEIDVGKTRPESTTAAGAHGE